MNASTAKADSRRDVEVRRQRRLLEREAEAIENRVKRKRDRSRDRHDVKKSKAQSPDEKLKKSDVESGEDAESGEEEESDEESESVEESSESDTASEQSGATPDRDEDSNAEEDEEHNSSEGADEGERSSDGTDEDTKASEGKWRSKRKNDFDRSRTPSKSPTPRRASSGEEGDNNSAEYELEETYKEVGQQKEKEKPDVEPEIKSPQPDIRDSLPIYLPSILGCRSVEEFHCLNRIEEGTYGVVYRARDKKTNEIVALKRLKMEREKEGFPITSLREINTLLISQHQNVVHVREIVVGSNMDKIFIVMDFVEHDMKSLMETMRQKNQVFLPGEVKCLMTQLLSAINHLHDNWILHRDLKTSNLLLSHNGILKVNSFNHHLASA